MLHGDACACWDGKFKGTYSLDKKSIMFNVEAESLGIFALTVMFTCVCNAGFKTILQTLIAGRLRLVALLPIAANAHGEEFSAGNWNLVECFVQQL